MNESDARRLEEPTVYRSGDRVPGAAAPRVSVVLGVYNAAPWIGATLASVQTQTYRDFEIVVVDDGSTDETQRKVERFGDAVRYIRQPNAGSAAARNEGVRRARGQYVAFHDGDDLWAPTKLEMQMALHEGNPELAWSYTDLLCFRSTSDLLHTGELNYVASHVHTLHEGWILRPLLLGNFIATPSVVVVRRVLDEVGGFREGVDALISEDWDLWLRLAAHHPVRCVRKPLTLVRQHPCRKTEQMGLDAALKAKLGHIERAVARHPDQLVGVRDEAVARVLVGAARKQMNREARREARHLLWEALRLHAVAPWAWMYLLASFVPRPLLKKAGKVRQHVRRSIYLAQQEGRR